MTEAASKNLNKNEKMRTTHPSYTEYKWNNIVREPAVRPQTQRPQTAQAGYAPARQSYGMNSGYVPSKSGSTVKNSATAARPTPGTVNRPYTPNSPGTRSNQGKNPNPAKNPNGISADMRPRTGTNPGRTSDSVSAKSRAANPSLDKQKTAQKIRRKSITTLHTIVSGKRYSFPISIILIAFSITVLILSIITTSVRISEITTVNAELQRKYTACVSTENELRLMLETRDDLRYVESIAKNEIGMVKKDQVTKYYLTVHKEDRIELVEETVSDKQNFIDEILSFGGSLVQRIRKFFGL